jgi:hypothetical protein
MVHSEEMFGGLESGSDFPELQELFSRNMDRIMSEKGYIKKGIFSIN